jgi:hypothetical protein
VLLVDDPQPLERAVGRDVERLDLEAPGSLVAAAPVAVDVDPRPARLAERRALGVVVDAGTRTCPGGAAKSIAYSSPSEPPDTRTVR